MDVASDFNQAEILITTAYVYLHVFDTAKLIITIKLSQMTKKNYSRTFMETGQLLIIIPKNTISNMDLHFYGTSRPIHVYTYTDRT